MEKKILFLKIRIPSGGSRIFDVFKFWSGLAADIFLFLGYSVSYLLDSTGNLNEKKRVNI